MKLEITVKYGTVSSITYTVFNDWSREQVWELLKKIEDLIGFNR